MAYDTQRTSPGAFTFFVNSHDIEAHDAFHVNARATRLGLDFAGPDLNQWGVTGKAEIDFYGAAITENRAGLLLRHAYGELKRDGWRLVGGQTYDVVSPLNPNMVNYAVGYAAGNIGFRSPQVRAEYTWEPGPSWKLTSQGSLNRTIVADFAEATPNEGHDAGWPTIMARQAIAYRPDDEPQHALEIGVSGHIGQVAVDFEVPPIQQDRIFNSWSLNADARLPLSDRFGLQGEFFIGQALSTFLGGINQSIDATSRTAIPSIGGWGEIWFRLNDDWHCHFGYGTDDPRNDVLTFGRRSRNQMFFGNVMWDVSPHLLTGLELSHWDTSFIGLAPNQAWRIEMEVKYHF